MADARQCDNTQPHNYHGWEEDVPLGKHFHVCGGISDEPNAGLEGISSGLAFPANQLKCPSCGELMGSGIPYVSWGAFDPDVPHSARLSAGDRAPDWLLNRPPSGHRFECAGCGCKIDVPFRDSTKAV